MAVLFVHSDLQRVPRGVVDRREVLGDGGKGLKWAAILYHTWRRGRKIDVRRRISGPAEVVLMNGPLADVADADVEAFLQLMLDSKVVLLRVRGGRGVLRNGGRVSTECSRSREGRIHGDGRD